MAFPRITVLAGVLALCGTALASPAQAFQAGPDPEFTCHGLAAGTYPDPLDPYYYHLCISVPGSPFMGEAVLFCEAGTIFDKAGLTCAAEIR